MTEPNAPAPNIVLIMVDDLRADELELGFGRSIDGWESALVEDLIDRGTTFDNFFATTPLCCPSRVSFLTGLYSHNHTVHGNNYEPTGGFGGWARFVEAGWEDDHLGSWLRSGGYHTALIGKYMNGYPYIGPPSQPPRPETYVPAGWDEFYASNWPDDPTSYYRFWMNENGVRVDYGEEEEAYLTDLNRDIAVDYIERRAAFEQPFFLFISTNAPHAPLLAAPRHVGAHNELEPAAPPSLDEPDLSDKPAHVAAGAVERPMDRWLVQTRRTLDMTLALDELIGDVMTALDTSGELDSTFVFFVSDNGLLRGEHRLGGKASPYEESILTPLIVRGPGIPAGVSVPHLTANLDLAPTLLELAGLVPPRPLDGESLVGPMTGAVPDAEWRSAMLFEMLVDLIDRPGRLGSVNNSAYPPWAAVRTDGHVYVEYATGETELYDLAADPFQLDSIPIDQADAALVAGLKEQLELLRACAATGCHAAAR